uniref:Methyltransferase domain-containing protein n=1 Tax=Acrobeloides nanus TaxID=290746 RepID=A0A914EKU1_9BILA
MVAEFLDQIKEITAHGALSMAIALGIKLNLFEALAEVSSEENPATPEQVAEIASLKPRYETQNVFDFFSRYVREWLCAMACGGIIEVDTTGEKFWIKKNRVEIMIGPSRNHAFTQTSMFPSYGKVFYDIVNVFQKDGPYGMDYSSYADFYQVMSALSQSWHKKTLVKDFIPMIGMKERLQEGILVLDVGCGNGFHVCELASHFPKSHFIGIDITQKAVDEANSRTNGHKNVEFICMNAADMSKEWTDKFDLVFIFDACHDQCRPDLSVKEIHRVLKPTGLFAMVEIDGTSNCYKDKQEKGSTAALFYTASLFHCLPVGSNTSDALGLGAMWGIERGKNLLKDAGFTNVKVEKCPGFEVNCVYLSHK